MAARASSAVKTWFSDPATYPIIGIITFAVSMSSFAGLRYLSNSPDVTFSKQKRGAIFHRDVSDGASFRSHRVSVATMKLNPITREDAYVEFKKRQA
ncbi:hypothetical protein THRCLA_20541 [Thraustotheca clavata]|uniref:Uncharacterized protein n=1 Tax=Thraustotheca clavata TaxID=74557 RepID=A0A1W0A629_9STRA|nr:hypothetical protein THRCLA_20541 [Thraustotheca clavata]